jgi:hypothetical protein
LKVERVGVRRSDDAILNAFVRLSTKIAVVLVILGVGAVIVGTALYDHGTLAFPLLVPGAIFVGEIAIGTIPCIMLLRAARLTGTLDLARVRNASIAGGLVLLPASGVTALFSVVANPCWDNPSCTGGATVEDGVLKAGIFALILAAAVALVTTPILLNRVRSSEERYDAS